MDKREKATLSRLAGWHTRPTADSVRRARSEFRNMTLKSYLTIMSAATVICWSAFSFVLWTVNPEITNWLGFVLFYLSLFLALSGTAAIVGFLVRFVGLKHELAFYSVRIAWRQSFLFSGLIIAILLLLSRDLLTWLNLFLLVMGLSILEYFLLNYSQGLRSRTMSAPEESEAELNNEL